MRGIIDLVLGVPSIVVFCMVAAMGCSHSRECHVTSWFIETQRRPLTLVPHLLDIGSSDFKIAILRANGSKVAWLPRPVHAVALSENDAVLLESLKGEWRVVLRDSDTELPIQGCLRPSVSSDGTVILCVDCAATSGAAVETCDALRISEFSARGIPTRETSKAIPPEIRDCAWKAPKLFSVGNGSYVFGVNCGSESVLVGVSRSDTIEILARQPQAGLWSFSRWMELRPELALSVPRYPSRVDSDQCHW
jgi:hypothetical protein